VENKICGCKLKYQQKILGNVLRRSHLLSQFWWKQNRKSCTHI